MDLNAILRIAVELGASDIHLKLVVASNCDVTAWDPNTDNLGIIANGDDGSGNSVVLANSARMQGSLDATKAVDVGSFAQYDGPMVAGTFKLANNIVTTSIR